MRRLLLSAIFALLLSPLAAQDSKERAAEILKKIDAAIQKESERTRGEILELVRKELRGAPAAEPQAAAPKAAAATTEAAKAVLTVDLLKKHAMYLASDELE